MKTKTTMATLSSSLPLYGAVIQYGRYVIETKPGRNKTGFGYTAKIYEAIEEPIESPGEESRYFTECQLKVAKRTTRLFVDAGHAIDWCISKID